jgi:hypothetical protein
MKRGDSMNAKKLFVTAVGALCFWLGSIAIAHAQSCDVNPVDNECPNPCYVTPGATEGCDPLIICDGQTFSTCDENMARSPQGSENWAGFRRLAQLTDRSFEKEMAAFLPRKSHSSCQVAALPKNTLFSLELN